MATQRLGIIMNGVTGRMGLNQHLVRSIVAIRKQGGVALANGDRVMPDPILVGRNAEKVAALAKQSGKNAEEAAASFISEHRPTSLIRRFGTVDEVANMVVYVASKEASATNGAALRVDGGVIRSIS